MKSESDTFKKEVIKLIMRSIRRRYHGRKLPAVIDAEVTEYVNLLTDQLCNMGLERLK